MSSRIGLLRPLFGALVSLVVLTGCNDSNSGNSVPTVQAPSTGTTPIPTGPTTQNPKIPNLTADVPINLYDKTNYSNLEDMFTNVFPPLVGDPQIEMSVSNDRSATPTGEVLISFEDTEGWAGWQLTAFPGASLRTSSSLDMIFSDESGTVRTVATLAGGQLNGTIYYRMRQSGEEQCVPVTVTCWSSNGSEAPSSDCSTTSYDTVDPCRAYMSLSDSQVKALGTFQASYSTWTTDGQVFGTTN